MATKKNKPESAAVKAFKEKYGNAKKLFPSEEEKALQAAEDRNYNEPVKTKAEPVNKIKNKRTKKGK